ncbi:hypothetical protein [Bradyrhizobium sp. Arg816]|uniref:hypothetical protein n=1 Tax=Bradyrhizobium sp. Arg816 TaxID=2998491 RepID=UPI00249DAC26|nr:hypothetical protein [Bradyrhizobium sp. Arg816]MDI3567493.1 hypothetical protein [Bradyrhizobium sp. Arg816]
MIPTGISFRSDPAYEDKCRAAAAIVEHMPAMDGWRLKLDFFDLDEIAQIRFDLAEIMEPAAEASFEGSLQEPSRQLREYRFRFNRKRRELIRHALDAAIDQVDRMIRATRPAIEAMEPRASIPEAALGELRTHYKEITTLMEAAYRAPIAGKKWAGMCISGRFVTSMTSNALTGRLPRRAYERASMLRMTRYP